MAGLAALRGNVLDLLGGAVGKVTGVGVVGRHLGKEVISGTVLAEL